MQRRRALIAAAAWPLACAAAGTAPGAAAPAGAGEPALRVVASFSILADLVREVAGPAAAVSSLVGADADVHGYEPTPADVRRLAQADLVVLNGLRFEGWIERLIAASGYRGTPLVATAGLEPMQVGPAADPHVWHSLAHAGHCAGTIAAALVAARPALEPAFGQRLQGLQHRLRQLDALAHELLDPIPEPLRCVATPHAAFGYLGQDYGIRFVAARGMAGGEPSAAQFAGLVRLVRSSGVRALFVESRGDPRLMQQLARDSGAALGGTLYADALSAPGTPADTYLRLYEHNLRTLATALRATLRA